MKFEKLTDDKIRIILNLDDLSAKNIDYHAFMSNSLESQDLFLDMLETAEREIGFITKDYKLLIEALGDSDRKLCTNNYKSNPRARHYPYSKQKSGY